MEILLLIKINLYYYNNVNMINFIIELVLMLEKLESINKYIRLFN
jgi:hypothetical protein